MEPTTGITLAAAAALSKPIEKLVDTVRDVMEPGLIVLKAHATAKAKVVDANAERKAGAIRAEGKIHELDILTRAQLRREAEEVRKHQNLESIVRKASEALPDTVSKDAVDPDWTAHFVEEAQNTSGEDMQALWARLLAGEVASPGTFSRRLVSSIKLLETTDARTFSILCRYIWKNVGCLIWEEYPHGLDFDQLNHLDTLGFINHDGLAGFAKPLPWPIKSERLRFVIEYHRKRALIEISGSRPDSGMFNLPWGNVIMTSLGLELAKLVEVTPDWEYFEKAVRYLAKQKQVKMRVLDDWEIV